MSRKFKAINKPGLTTVRLTCHLLFGIAIVLTALITCRAQTFTNSAQVAFSGGGGNGTPYGTSITVSGVVDPISTKPGGIKVRINRLQFQSPADLQMVLVGPTGAALLLQANAGGNTDSGHAQTYTLSDGPYRQIPPVNVNMIDGGVYRPTAYASPNFAAPGPGTTYANPGPVSGNSATFASTYGGSNANGTWSLYTRNVTNVLGGQIAAGWSIIFGPGDTSDLYAPSKVSFGVGDAVFEDQMGESVAVDGDIAVIGAPSDRTFGGPEFSGSAYVMVRESNGLWRTTVKLFAPQRAAGDFFGRDVAVSGDTIVISASEKTVNGNLTRGAVYVWKRNEFGNWGFEGQLIASDGAPGDLFGASVAIVDDTIIIGAPLDDAPATNQGSAYIFTRTGSTWTERQKLTDPSGATQDFFGFDVAISGSTVIIGAPFDSTDFIRHGSAHVFVNLGVAWSFQQRLANPTPVDLDRFGTSVDITNDGLQGYRVIIGDPRKTVTASQQGAAYTFRRLVSATTWTSEQTLVAADADSSDQFGTSVSIAGGTAIVGSFLDETVSNQPSKGSAYLFRRTGTTWNQARKLTAFDGTSAAFFGTSVALSSDTIIVGAPSTRQWEQIVGAVYMLRPDGRPFDLDGDWRADIGIFRPSNGQWWINRSFNGSTFVAQFGLSTDKMVPADYTGDGRTDIAFWRPANGTWYILRSEDFSFYAGPFGANGDIPTPGDYDSDGRADTAVFRPSNATWYIAGSTGPTIIQQFGANGDQPTVGDYDGDGRADLAIYRPSNGQWWINRSAAGGIVAQFGTSTDKPVQADFTGDGKTDIAFWRPSTGDWFVLRSENFSFFAFPFGTVGDIASPGDFDGDGMTDPAVFRPSNATWYIQRSTGGFSIQQFGANGDRPVEAAFIP